MSKKTEKPYKWNGYEIVYHKDLSNMIKNIEGVMLTIIDASCPDKEQREAVKSLVRNGIWKERERLSTMSATIESLKIADKCGLDQQGCISTKKK